MTERRLLDTLEGPSGASSDSPVNLGMEFYQDVEGWATALHFWRANSAVPGPVDVSIWEVDTTNKENGTLLGNTSMTWDQYDTGWITAVLPTPVHIVVGKFYKVQVNTVRYSATSNFFDRNYGLAGANGLDNGPLHAPNAQAAHFNSQGSYRYGTPNITDSQNTGDNYWVDVTVSDVPPSGGATDPVVKRLENSTWVNSSFIRRWDNGAWVDAHIHKT